MSNHTPTHYDYAVIGCGTIGSMALWQLTELAPEASVLGIERFDRVHTKGSYSGESRLFRVALKEGGIYIPMVQDARRMWLEMNERSGRDIFLPVGALSVGPADFPAMTQTMAVIEEFGLDHEVLDAAGLAERFPVFAAASPDTAADAAILDPAGGGIRPELAVAYAQEFALAAGASLWDNTRVLAVEPGAGPEGATLIRTSAGDVTADKVIVANGSWASDLYPDLAGHISVQCIPLTWYLPLDITGFLPENLPIFMRDIITADGEIWHCYGAPSIDGYSVKISHGDFIGDAPTPDTLEALRTGELPDEVLRVFSERTSAFFDGMLDAPVRITLHHDGFTTDHAPVLGHAPGTDGAVTVATGMSGNGMKFAPVYGRIAAELAVTGHSDRRPDAFDYPTTDREPSAAIIPATLH
ncbi:FAD-dependent oxidoreductase [Corynebacterium terpenotabidum]|uniref:Putative sarcosine oxidase n=1 Tax=Corynebacterium terpenotabidum Y-11 TaxID=1200352 RepID=S4XD72_9CORY|nr:FAD-dependent oxidoreductase [Corynebacterium terpenotabidum]AGP30454.1 putative sarcosine oxidase [Corynebacterium terpenotabidum Y-11]